MSVSEIITRLATKNAADRSTLESLITQLDADTENETIKAQVGVLSKAIKADGEALILAQESERALMRSALPVAPAIVHARTLRDQFKEDYIWRAAVVAIDAHLNRRPLEESLRERYGDDHITRDLCTLSLNHHTAGRGYGILRAAANAANTTSVGWAAELVQMQYGAFLWALRGRSAVGSIAWPYTDNFLAGAPIKVPRVNDLDGIFPANFEAAFRAEGAPIRVGSMFVNSETIYPFSMGVIGAYTRELLQRSNPSIEAVIREEMIRNTSAIMDNVVFDSAAASATRPAGLANNMDGVDSVPATPTPTMADVDRDLTGRVKQLVAARKMGGPNTYWIMNRANAVSLSSILTATGVPLYGDIADGAALKGYKVAQSHYFPIDRVLLIDTDNIFMAGGSPEFEISNEATVHMENTTPLEIATPGAPATVAAPTTSLWQTNKQALRMLIETSWHRMRNGAVQELTGVAW